MIDRRIHLKLGRSAMNKTAIAGRYKKASSAGSSKPPAGFEHVFERIYKLVLKIPSGRVMTYGQIARLLEDRYSPRLVGWAMHAVPHDERNIPWHRVINSRGGISTGKVHPAEPDLQQWMLEAEGVVFDHRGCCNLALYQWSPRKHASRRKTRASRDNFSDRGKSSTVKKGKAAR